MQIFTSTKNYSKLLLFVFFCLSFAQDAFSTQYYSRNGGGNWNDGTKWSLSCNGASAAAFPVAGDTANICNGHPITVNVPSECARLIVVAGAVLTVTSTLNVNIGFAATIVSSNAGTITGAGTLTVATGAVANNTLNNTNIVSVATLAVNAGAFFTSVTFNNTGTITSSTITLTRGSVIASCTFNNNAGGTVTSTTVTINTGARFNNNTTCTISTTLDGAGRYDNLNGSILYFTGASIAVTTFNASAATNLVDYNRTTGGQTVRNVTYYDLTLSGTGNQTKTLGGNSVVSNDLTISNTAIFSVGTFTLSVGGDWTVNSTDANPFIEGTQTVTFNGTGAQAITGTVVAQTFYNIIVNKTVATTLSKGGSTVTLTCNDLTQTQGNFDASGFTTLNINATTGSSDILLTAGTFTAPTTINITGNWTNNGATFVQGNGIVNFTGTVAQTLGGTVATQTFNFITVNKTAGQTLSQTGSTLTLRCNDLTITQGNFNASGFTTQLQVNISAGASDVTLTAGTFTAPPSILVTGNWTNNGGTFTPGTGTVDFRGNAGQTIGGTAVSQTFNNIIMNTSAVGQTLSTAGSTVTINCNDITLTRGTFNAPATINVAGSWSKAAVATAIFTPGAGLVNFNGTTAQTIGGAGATTFNNLTFANTSGLTPAIILGIATNVNNTLTMSSGIVNLATFVLTLGSSAAAPGTLSYTNGWLYGTGTFTRWMAVGTYALLDAKGHFPIGSSADYRPFWMGITTANLSTGGTVSLSHTGVYPAATNVASHADGAFGTVVAVSQSTWNVSTATIVAAAATRFNIRYGGTGFATNALADVNASLAASVVGTFAASTNAVSPIEANRTTLTLAQLNGGGTQNFRLGSRNTGTAPLPIELLEFTATPNNAVVDLKWSTATQTNNDYFTVEKTQDGVTFETVAIVDGAGTTTALMNYSCVDYTPYQGVSYYRLKQTDFDGKYTYSNMEVLDLKSNLKSAAFNFDVYPNPSSGENLNIALNANQGAEVLVVVYDVFGKESYSTVHITSVDGENIYSVDLSNKLNAGIYMIAATSNENVINKKLIVK